MSWSEGMYIKLIGYGQTGHDNMWDSIGQGLKRKGKGKVVFFVQRPTGLRSIWIPTKSVRNWGFGPELSNSD